MQIQRRRCVLAIVGIAASLAFVDQMRASEPEVAESDPRAQALGYKADASTVDKSKYAKYVSGQKCATCQFFQGNASGGMGMCAPLGGNVRAAGWCSAYSAKAVS